MNQQPDDTTYLLDEQVGFLMRRANQRHLSIFARHIPDMTPMQFAALTKLCDMQNMSQNALGRATAMDAATIKGVVDRLRKRGFVTSVPDTEDQRRVTLSVTAEGQAKNKDLIKKAQVITEETLSLLDAGEQAVFLRLLGKLG